jgi:hypothetical protein
MQGSVFCLYDSRTIGNASISELALSMAKVAMGKDSSFRPAREIANSFESTHGHRCRVPFTLELVGHLYTGSFSDELDQSIKR